MENIEENIANNEKMRISIYPERISNPGILEEKIKLLSDLENGKIPNLEINEKERENIRRFEWELGEKLEKIYDINIKTISLYNEYFLTEEGRNDFEKTLGKTLDGYSEQDMVRFLYENSQELLNLASEKRTDFAARSREYSENRLIKDIEKTLGEDGDIDVSKVKAVENVRILLNPSDFSDKISALREFKKELKEYKKEIASDSFENNNEDYKEALMGVIELYQSRVNLLLVENYRNIFMIKRKSDVMGVESLGDDEKKILSESVGLEREVKNLSRYDKFVFGVSRKYDSHGERVQVGKELDDFVNNYEDEYLKSLLLGKEQVRSVGIDWKKINEKSISEEEKINLAEEVLRSYDLLSAYPAAEYTKDRLGPAPDNKWQFVVRNEFKKMSVDSKRKVIKCKKGDDNIRHVLNVVLAHEIEGHVLQHENKSKLPFKIFKRVGSGRTDILAECAAMENQNFVSNRVFNNPSLPHPNYIRAMQKRLHGGNYLECVKEFYKSAIKLNLLEKAGGDISQEEFNRRCKKKIELAVDRTRRLFRGENYLSSADKFLANSKDTAYVEQMMLFKELKKYGLEKYIFILGANLDTLIFLMRSGFINPDDINKPKYYSLKIWERMKDKYLIEEKSENT